MTKRAIITTTCRTAKELHHAAARLAAVAVTELDRRAAVTVRKIGDEVAAQRKGGVK